MATYQAVEPDELQADRSRSYAEFLRRPGMSMGGYHLPAGGKDLQHPHAADEVYVVLAGRGALEVEGERIDVWRDAWCRWTSAPTTTSSMSPRIPRSSWCSRRTERPGISMQVEPGVYPF
jgi:hypothetical protein